MGVEGMAELYQDSSEETLVRVTENLLRNVEAVGSNPITSTGPKPWSGVVFQRGALRKARPALDGLGCPPPPVRGLRPVRLVPAEWTDPARVDRRDYR